MYQQEFFGQEMFSNASVEPVCVWLFHGQGTRFHYENMLLKKLWKRNYEILKMPGQKKKKEVRFVFLTIVSVSLNKKNRRG